MTAMTPSEAAGRAFWLIEHPNVDPSCWDLLDEEMRAYWIEKARPVWEAGAAAVWDECENSRYEIRLDPTGKFWEPRKTNPYRKAAA
jgi:hypothetical protein